MKRLLCVASVMLTAACANQNPVTPTPLSGRPVTGISPDARVSSQFVQGPNSCPNGQVGGLSIQVAGHTPTLTLNVMASVHHYRAITRRYGAPASEKDVAVFYFDDYGTSRTTLTVELLPIPRNDGTYEVRVQFRNACEQWSQLSEPVVYSQQGMEGTAPDLPQCREDRDGLSAAAVWRRCEDDED